MSLEKLRKACLVIGGLASAAMAGFHFVLTHVFGWARFVSKIPSPIRWGLFSINVFFSALLLWGGITTIITAVNESRSTLTGYCIFFGMGMSWIINASYQIVYPFPHVIMRWVLLGFSISVALLYSFGVLMSFDERGAKLRV